jgi:hypothetical protein
MRCSRIAGFQGRSTFTTVLAACKLRPVAPAFGEKLTNGFYCQIEGERNKYEVWNILYKFINEFVKHEYIYFEAEDPDKEAAYIQFEIDNAGRTQNIIIAEKTKYVKPIEKKIIKTISEWNFGDKNKKDSGKTTIDVIFTFNKHKIVCNQITDY